MTTMEQEPARTLGNLEGRIEEQSKAIENVQSSLADTNRRMGEGFAETNRRIDEGLREVRSGQRQILIATWVIGGGVITALIGSLIALIVLIVRLV